MCKVPTVHTFKIWDKNWLVQFSVSPLWRRRHAGCLLTGVWNLNLQFYRRHKMSSLHTWTKLFFLQISIIYFCYIYHISYIFLFYFCYVPSLKNKTNINFYKKNISESLLWNVEHICLWSFQEEKKLIKHSRVLLFWIIKYCNFAQKYVTLC